MPPFCSIIVPTIGRSTLPRAVQSILDQAVPAEAVEVIVVNDSGVPLPPAEWQASPRTRVITTNRRERSMARNAGAALARGRYLGFLDDDDWLVPGALEALRTLADQSGEAAWLYGGLQVVDEQGRILGEANSAIAGNGFAQVVGGAWVPLQASLIRADLFFQVGGFDPFICGTEDLDLCRRVALHGALANTPDVVACLFRGPTWNTSTDYGRAVDDTRRSRDRLLRAPGAFRRLIRSVRRAPEPSYWSGRLARVYASTSLVNLRRGRVIDAVGFALTAVAIMVASGRGLLSTRFREGAKAHHVPGTLHFITLAGEADAGAAERTR